MSQLNLEQRFALQRARYEVSRMSRPALEKTALRLLKTRMEQKNGVQETLMQNDERELCIVGFGNRVELYDALGLGLNASSESLISRDPVDSRCLTHMFPDRQVVSVNRSLAPSIKELMTDARNAHASDSKRCGNILLVYRSKQRNWDADTFYELHAQLGKVASKFNSLCYIYFCRVNIYFCRCL